MRLHWSCTFRRCSILPPQTRELEINYISNTLARTRSGTTPKLEYTRNRVLQTGARARTSLNIQISVGVADAIPEPDVHGRTGRTNIVRTSAQLVGLSGVRA